MFVSLKMDKIVYRAVIKFFVKEGLTPNEIHSKFNYLEKDKTITGEYYSNLLTRLDEKIREESHGLQKKKSSFIKTIHPPTEVFWQWKN